MSFQHVFLLSPLLMFSLICCLTSSCTPTLLSQRGPYLRAYHEGALDEVEGRLDSLIDETALKEHNQRSKEASWIRLDQATLHFAMGKTKEAIIGYKEALEALDYYAQELPLEQCAQLLLQDDTGAYQADDFEQVLARVYFALALLHQGDEKNAYALLRQAEEYQQKTDQLYKKIPFTQDYVLKENGLSKYLFALLLEKRGDRSNAKILYQEAAQLVPYSNGLCFCPSPPSEQATVLVICHNGNAPYKISATSPASVASSCALECLLATKGLDPAWSSLTGIPVPALSNWPGSCPLQVYSQVGENRQPLLPFYDVRKAASDQLKQKMPLLVARGVARLLIRRAAIGYLNERDPRLGVLADLSMWIANEHTRADTRSWTTLPARLDVARFDVAPGCHSFHLQVNDPQRIDQQTYSLELHPHELCIIHIFNIHPGVRRVLIPARYLTNKTRTFL